MKLSTVPAVFMHGNIRKREVIERKVMACPLEGTEEVDVMIAMSTMTCCVAIGARDTSLCPPTCCKLQLLWESRAPVAACPSCLNLVSQFCQCLPPGVVHSLPWNGGAHGPPYGIQRVHDSGTHSWRPFRKSA